MPLADSKNYPALAAWYQTILSSNASFKDTMMSTTDKYRALVAELKKAKASKEEVMAAVGKMNKLKTLIPADA